MTVPLPGRDTGKFSLERQTRCDRARCLSVIVLREPTGGMGVGDTCFHSYQHFNFCYCNNTSTIRRIFWPRIVCFARRNTCIRDHRRSVVLRNLQTIAGKSCPSPTRNEAYRRYSVEMLSLLLLPLAFKQKTKEEGQRLRAFTACHRGWLPKSRQTYHYEIKAFGKSCGEIQND